MRLPQLQSLPASWQRRRFWRKTIRPGPSPSSSPRRPAAALTSFRGSSERNSPVSSASLSLSRIFPAPACHRHRGRRQGGTGRLHLQTGLNASVAVNPSLFKHMPYDPVADFTPVGMMAEFPFAIVVRQEFSGALAQRTHRDGQERPGEINYASAGMGTGQQLSMELFKLMTGTNFTHVPYRGAAPAYTDVIPARCRSSSITWRARSARSKAAPCARSPPQASRARHCCRTCQRSRRPACRTRRTTRGSVCGRRKKRRNPSSPSCTRSWKRRSPRPPCVRALPLPPVKPWTCRLPISTRS